MWGWSSHLKRAGPSEGENDCSFTYSKMQALSKKVASQTSLFNFINYTSNENPIQMIFKSELNGLNGSIF